MKNKSRFHVHIRAVPAIAFIVAIAAAAGYAIWSKSYLGENAYYPFEVYKNRGVFVDTGEWKTYRNEEHGFGMKYPEEFTAAFDNSLKTLELNADKKKKELTGLRLSIKENPESISLSNWWKQSKNYSSSYITENIQGEGASGIKAYSPDKRVFATYVFLPWDKSVYEFHWTTLNERIADEILSTFYFFTRKDPLESWKIYQSQQHGFELKYPEQVTVTVQTDAVVKFMEKGAVSGGLPVILIHSMEVSSVSQKWLNDVLANYALTTDKPVLDGKTVSTAAGRGEFKNHTLYIVPKDSGTSALIEVSNSDLGRQIFATFKFVK